MGVVTEVAQSVAESLLGKNAAGFSRAMKDRQEAGKPASEAKKKPAQTAGQPLQGMAKGGKVRATGKRRLHKGEMVARKAPRTKCRGGRR